VANAVTLLRLFCVVAFELLHLSMIDLAGINKLQKYFKIRLLLTTLGGL